MADIFRHIGRLLIRYRTDPDFRGASEWSDNKMLHMDLLGR